MKSLNKYIVLFVICSLIFLNCTKDNTPPVAVFTFYPEAGDSLTVFTLDASGCFDNENYIGGLQVRWDFNNDGIWDTDYSFEKIINHCFFTSGIVNVKLEVIDDKALSGSYVKEINLLSENIKSIITDERDGRIYKTVKIEDQWWMSENLNYGTLIKSNVLQTNNDTVEKYYYGDSDSAYIKHGGLYQWDEAMNYSKDTAAQGICPLGWHIPTKNDWNMVMEKYNPTVAPYYEPGGITGLNFITSGMLWHYMNYHGQLYYRQWWNKTADGYLVENFWTSDMLPIDINQAAINYYEKHRKQFIYYLDLDYDYPFEYAYSTELSAMPVRCVKNN